VDWGVGCLRSEMERMARHLPVSLSPSTSLTSRSDLLQSRILSETTDAFAFTPALYDAFCQRTREERARAEAMVAPGQIIDAVDPGPPIGGKTFLFQNRHSYAPDSALVPISWAIRLSA